MIKRLCIAVNPALALWLPSTSLAGRVAGSTPETVSMKFYLGILTLLISCALPAAESATNLLSIDLV